MKSFVIEATTHQDFLNEQRKDPITGDIIKEGDEIIFCASCKSAFLKTSWLYLHNTHCDQNQTLLEFPQSISLFIQVQNYHSDTLFLLHNQSNTTSEDFLSKVDAVIWKKQAVKLRIEHIFISSIQINTKTIFEETYTTQLVTASVGTVMSAILGFSFEKENYTITILSMMFFLSWLILLLMFDKNDDPTNYTSLYKENRKFIDFQENQLMLYFENEQQSLILPYQHISHSILSINFLGNLEIRLITDNTEEMSFIVGKLDVVQFEKLLLRLVTFPKYISIENKGLTTNLTNKFNELASVYPQLWVK